MSQDTQIPVSQPWTFKSGSSRDDSRVFSFVSSSPSYFSAPLGIGMTERASLCVSVRWLWRFTGVGEDTEGDSVLLPVSRNIRANLSKCRKAPGLLETPSENTQRERQESMQGEPSRGLNSPPSASRASKAT